MAQPIFRPYTQGIQPLRGQMEAGQFIGQMIASGLNSFGDDIAKGFEGYTKNKIVAEGAIARAGSMSNQFDALYNAISGVPELQGVANAIKKQRDTLASAPTMATPKALAEIEGAAAFQQALPTIISLTQQSAKYKATAAIGEGLASESMPKGGYETVPIMLEEGEAIYDPTRPLVEQLTEMDNLAKQAEASGAIPSRTRMRKSYIAKIREALRTNTTWTPDIRNNVIAQLDSYERSEARFDQYLFPEIYGDDLLSPQNAAPAPVPVGAPLFNPPPFEPTGEGVSMSPQEAMQLNPNQTYIAASGPSVTALPRDSWFTIARRAGIDVGNRAEFYKFIDSTGLPANHIFKGGEIIPIPDFGNKTPETIRLLERDRQRKAGTLEAEEPFFNPPEILPDVPEEPQAPIAQAPVEPPSVVVQAPVSAQVPRQAPPVARANPQVARPAPAVVPTVPEVVVEPKARDEGLPLIPEGGFGGFGRTYQPQPQAPVIEPSIAEPPAPIPAEQGLSPIPEGGFGGFGTQARQAQQAQPQAIDSGEFADVLNYIEADRADQERISKPALGKGNEYDSMWAKLNEVKDPVKRKEAEQNLIKYWVERSNAVGAGPKGNRVLPPSMQISTGTYVDLIRSGKTDEEIKEMVKKTEALYLGQGLGEQINEAAKAGDIEKLEALREQVGETDENWWGVATGLGITGGMAFLQGKGNMRKILPQLQQAAALPKTDRIAQLQSEIAAAEKGIFSSGRRIADRSMAQLNKELVQAIDAENAADDAARARGQRPTGTARPASPAAARTAQAAQAADKVGFGTKLLNVGKNVGKWGGKAIAVLGYGDFLYQAGLLTAVGFDDTQKARQQYLSGNLGIKGYTGGIMGLNMVDMAMGPNLEELRATDLSYQEQSKAIADARRRKFVEQTGYQGADEIKPLTLGEVEIGVQKEFRAADRAEQEKYLRDFVVSKLGYLPMDYEAIKNTFMPDQPRFIETEYGTFYKGKADDAWQPYKQQAASIQDMRKEYTGVYGTPDGNRGFKPIRLEGGVSIAGVFKGTDGMLKDFDSGVRLASEARIALASLKKLIQDNPIGKSLSPDLRGEALTLINRIKPAMRIDIVGVGTVSNFEQGILSDSLKNPTEIFSFDSTSLRQIELIQQQFDRGLRNQGQLYGLQISLSDPLGLDRTAQIREAKLRRRANQSPQ